MDKELADFVTEYNKRLVAEGLPPAEFAPGELERWLVILSRSDNLVDDGTPEFWGDQDFPVLDDSADVLAVSVGGSASPATTP